MMHEAGGAYLIVNADDYGYFDCVTAGILKAASLGIVTATGVIANVPNFQEHAAKLRGYDALDVGVHLNLTDGFPLTGELRSALSRSSGRFPGKFRMAAAILRGAAKIEDVRREWKAQIDRCLGAGLSVRFLNSHEHIHMLPALFSVIQELADDYAIAHIRFPKAHLSASGGSVVRGAIMGALEAINRRHDGATRARFLGLETSGRLDLGYLERTLPRLRKGDVYELMCHPGEFDAGEVTDPHLRRYHDWEGELRTLTSPSARELLRRHGVRLIGYRQLEIRGVRLVVKNDALAPA
jgi:predicted glycoside hydrolase/deacetylase ChbG (UPF0249 family)